MNRLTLAAASAAALITLAITPALAGPVEKHGDGFVSLAAGAGSAAFADDGTTFRGMSLEGAASAQYDVTALLGFQGDLIVRSQTYTDVIDLTEWSFDGALHSFTRDSQKYLLGGFVQVGRDGFLVNGERSTYEIGRTYAGIEGQVFLDKLTLYGQAGATQLAYPGLQETGWFANAEARYFLTPDFKLEAHVGGDRLSSTGQFLGETDTVRLGIGAEYRLPEAPFSLFAKYDYTHQMFGGTFGYNDNRVVAGIKFNIGGDTLLARDRSGASLKPIDSVQQYSD